MMKGQRKKPSGYVANPTLLKYKLDSSFVEPNYQSQLFREQLNCEASSENPQFPGDCRGYDEISPSYKRPKFNSVSQPHRPRHQKKDIENSNRRYSAQCTQLEQSLENRRKSVLRQNSRNIADYDNVTTTHNPVNYHHNYLTTSPSLFQINRNALPPTTHNESRRYLAPKNKKYTAPSLQPNYSNMTETQSPPLSRSNYDDYGFVNNSHSYSIRRSSNRLKEPSPENVHLSCQASDVKQQRSGSLSLTGSISKSVSRVMKRRKHVVLLGLDGSGKTTILMRLKYGCYVATTPTVGFNHEKVWFPFILT